MSFEDWVNQSSAEQREDGEDEQSWAFAHAARARAQAERESNRGRRRSSWRTRAELLRRTLSRREAERRGWSQGDSNP